ncbi:hypothetical protein FHR95_001685 [Halomonas fontilapidosi]|uniref:Glycosyltransferase 2-like domain-containing protein n=1 Tax=Halomonas fontilapidosi TaxID=616675 RepID=A0A7W5DKA8_9GAMM|nr:glycosyltransferase [Halomonas fontilapidosi]MBB3184125.1 hypothetical protein [Halomonas fontilapidosi]
MIVCTILLDARSAGAGLPRYLAALRPLRQRRDLHLEVMLANDTETPRLRRLASEYDARLVTTEGTPLGDRLNMAMAHSQGQALLFPAARYAIPAAWLATALKDIEQHRRDAVVLTSSPPGRLKQFWQRLRHEIPAETLCVSRAWFELIGGCDPALDADALPDLIARLRACQARIAAVVA